MQLLCHPDTQTAPSQTGLAVPTRRPAGNPALVAHWHAFTQRQEAERMAQVPVTMDAQPLGLGWNVHSCGQQTPFVFENTLWKTQHGVVLQEAAAQAESLAASQQRVQQLEGQLASLDGARQQLQVGCCQLV